MGKISDKTSAGDDSSIMESTQSQVIAVDESTDIIIRSSTEKKIDDLTE